MMAAFAGGCSVAEVTPRLVDKLLAQYPACLGFPWPNPLFHHAEYAEHVDTIAARWNGLVCPETGRAHRAVVV